MDEKGWLAADFETDVADGLLVGGINRRSGSANLHPTLDLLQKYIRYAVTLSQSLISVR